MCLTGSSDPIRYRSAVRSSRCCTRNNCREPAVATLTYVYATSTAVVGPLARSVEPHAYDLCEAHARGLTAPRGWELVRHDGDLRPPPQVDDLLALADAVLESPPVRAGFRPGPGPARRGGSRGRRHHLRVVGPR